VPMVFQMLYSGYGLPESAVAMAFQSLQWLWSSSVCSGNGLPESGGQCSSRVCSKYCLPESAVSMVFQSLQRLWSSRLCRGYGLPARVSILQEQNNSPKALRGCSEAIEAEVTMLSD
jgi:hypothetical protein